MGNHIEGGVAIFFMIISIILSGLIVVEDSADAQIATGEGFYIMSSNLSKHNCVISEVDNGLELNCLQSCGTD